MLDKDGIPEADQPALSPDEEPKIHLDLISGTETAGRWTVTGPLTWLLKRLFWGNRRWSA